MQDEQIQNLKIYKKDNKKFTFLITDDSPFMWKQVRRVIELIDGEVVGEANNGAECIKLYQKLKPDFVTLDITMPVMNGLDALKELKKIDANAKVIMLTAIGFEERIKECILAGAIHYIVKPFKIEEVAKKNYITNKEIFL